MNVLFVDYDPFAMESRVSIYRDNKRTCVSVSSSIDETVEQLIALANQEQLYTIKFHAPAATFFEVKRQIEDAERRLYNANKISLEII